MNRRPGKKTRFSTAGWAVHVELQMQRYGTCTQRVRRARRAESARRAVRRRAQRRHVTVLPGRTDRLKAEARGGYEIPHVCGRLEFGTLWAEITSAANARHGRERGRIAVRTGWTDGLKTEPGRIDKISRRRGGLEFRALRTIKAGPANTRHGRECGRIAVRARGRNGGGRLRGQRNIVARGRHRLCPRARRTIIAGSASKIGPRLNSTRRAEKREL